MNTSKKRIAILGATGHIAKGLIYGFNKSGKDELYLFARSVKKLTEFLNSINNSGKYEKYIRFQEFDHFKYDVVINCVGVGDPEKLKNMSGSIFTVTEIYDNLVLNYLETNPQVLYINFSSGAVYGKNFDSPVVDTSQITIDINNITPSDFYSIAKINTEAKHRALKNLRIVDLRVFGYFSRFIELEAKFFLSEVISCIKYGREFVTGPGNMVRDYINLQDLVSLIENIILQIAINDAFDVYSLKPVTKFEISDYFQKSYGFKYILDTNINTLTITGSKEYYYSNSKKAQSIGYQPLFNH